MEIVEIASGLRFPEGPIALKDGRVIVVEMFGPRLTMISPDGSKETIAEISGGPNGAAIGPDGELYLCNNGGCFTEIDFGDLCLPGPFDASRYIGGRIQKVNIDSGRVVDLYTECDGRPLRAPKDLVFDQHGGFYFTDHGIRDNEARTSDITGIYYAMADGSMIREIAFPVEGPNGLGFRLTVAGCIGLRPIPGEYSNGKSWNRVSWLRQVRATPVRSCVDYLDCNFLIHWPLTDREMFVWPPW